MDGLLEKFDFQGGAEEPHEPHVTCGIPPAEAKEVFYANLNQLDMVA